MASPPITMMVNDTAADHSTIRSARALTARQVRLTATDVGVEYQGALADLERALGGPIR